MHAALPHRANERWNTAFGRKAVHCGTLLNDEVSLAGGMKLTLLSADAKALTTLRNDWKKNAISWEIKPGDLEDAWDQLVEQTKFHPETELNARARGPER